jgi:hypothetical protein
VQLCDVPAKAVIADYLDEAMYERLPPGDGHLPLAELLSAIPANRIVGLEVPQRSLAEIGVPPEKRLATCVAKARALLAALSDAM